jgi:hypothetical protein
MANSKEFHGLFLSSSGKVVTGVMIVSRSEAIPIFVYTYAYLGTDSIQAAERFDRHRFICTDRKRLMKLAGPYRASRYSASARMVLRGICSACIRVLRQLLQFSSKSGRTERHGYFYLLKDFSFIRAYRIHGADASDAARSTRPPEKAGTLQS